METPLPARDARSGWMLPAALGLLGATAIAGAAWWGRGNDVPRARPDARSAAFASRPSAPEPDRTSPPPEKIPSKDVADAFEAATGHRAAFSVEDGEDIVITRPVQIVQLPFGRALLTEEEIEDGCQGCVGAIGVFYLKEADGRLIVTGRWPRAAKGWTFGLPPTDWQITQKFTTYPAIYATGGFLQGTMTSGATITELRPSGPAESDVIRTEFDNSRSEEEGKRHCVVNGRIANVRKDKSFDVIVTGSRRAVDHYRKSDGRFQVVSRIDWDFPCGWSAEKA
jgi:hypothetical protein